MGLGWPQACKMVVAASTQGGVLLAGVGWLRWWTNICAHLAHAMMCWAQGNKPRPPPSGIPPGELRVPPPCCDGPPWYCHQPWQLLGGGRVEICKQGSLSNEFEKKTKIPLN